MCDFGLSKTKDKHAEIFLAMSLVAHTIKDGCCWSTNQPSNRKRAYLQCKSEILTKIVWCLLPVYSTSVLSRCRREDSADVYLRRWYHRTGDMFCRIQVYKVHEAQCEVQWLLKASITVEEKIDHQPPCDHKKNMVGERLHLNGFPDVEVVKLPQRLVEGKCATSLE